MLRWETRGKGEHPESKQLLLLLSCLKIWMQSEINTQKQAVQHGYNIQSCGQSHPECFFLKRDQKFQDAGMLNLVYVLCCSVFCFILAIIFQTETPSNLPESHHRGVNKPSGQFSMQYTAYYDGNTRINSMTITAKSNRALKQIRITIYERLILMLMENIHILHQESRVLRFQK